MPQTLFAFQLGMYYAYEQTLNHGGKRCLLSEECDEFDDQAILTLQRYIGFVEVCSVL